MSQHHHEEQVPGMEGAGTVPPHSHHQNASQQEQLLSPGQQQQAAVNFNPNAPGTSGYASRRVTIGGVQGSQNMDRRGSLASTGFNMDDFFGGRRASLGFDVGMDQLFGRRDSMDSTTAVLDAAIFDLTRKRYSMAMGDLGGSGPNPPNLSNFPSMGNLGPPGMSMSTSGYNMNANPNYSIPPPPLPNSNTAAAIAARQQQLQEQQRDLERRQKDLEAARQQLIASMQERNGYMMHQAGPPQTISTHQQSSGGGMGWGQPPHSGAYRRSSLDVSTRGLDMSNRGSTMDFASRGNTSMDLSHRSGHGYPQALDPRGASMDLSNRSSNASSTSQWWVCQVCNSKAFASHEEAMAHEQVCQDGPRAVVGGRHDPMAPLSIQEDPANRNYSLGTMDSSTHSAYEQTTLSSGPFADMKHPMPLSMPSDKDWLTPLHCFVRRHCVEVFTASEHDVATPSKGKRKPITVGQVGIRCPHCHHQEDPVEQSRGRERGSVYYPTTIASIYNATMNLLQRHLHSCTSVPENIMRRYETLKADDARSGTSKRYWIESARSLGLVDTAMGIRFSALPPSSPSTTLVNSQQESDVHEAFRRGSNDFFTVNSSAVPGGDIKDPPSSGMEQKAPATPTGARVPTSAGMGPTGHDMMFSSGPLVAPGDKPYSTTFSYHLLSQMQPCVFTEADRLGKRKGLPPGFPGLACRHCFGGYGSGRFFPSSIKTLSDTSKTLNVLHNHMMRCRKCPADVRETLERLRGSHDDERAKMKFGSQKAFFARIWDRLHGKDAVTFPSPPPFAADGHGSPRSPKGKRKAPPSSPGPQIYPPPPYGGASMRGGGQIMAGMPPQTAEAPQMARPAHENSPSHAFDMKRQKSH